MKRQACCTFLEDTDTIFTFLFETPGVLLLLAHNLNHQRNMQASASKTLKRARPATLGATLAAAAAPAPTDNECLSTLQLALPIDIENPQRAVPYSPNPDCITDIRTQLDVYGFAIVTDVLSAHEVNRATTLMQQWQATVPDYSWIHSNLDPHGVHKFHQVGHQAFAWDIRTNRSVRHVFAGLHGVADADNGLVASFDGSCYIAADCAKTDNCWLHTDQAPKLLGRRCIQGFVSLTTNTSDGATFVCVPGSHLLHRDYFVANGLADGSSNFQKIERRHVEALNPTQRVALDVPAGSLVLWDSRTFHQNQYGTAAEERRVQYVCYLPKDDPGNTEAMRAKRRQYLADKRTTSHWPYPLRVNGLQGQTFGNARRKIDYGALVEPDLGPYMAEIAKLV